MKPKHIEHLGGIGHLTDQGQAVAKVRYSIDLYEEQIDTSTLADTSSTPGLKYAEIEIDVIEGKKFLDAGEVFTLLLADKRQCTVVVQRVSLPSTHYTFIALELGDLVNR
jgi:hypothetical protein